MGPVISVKQAKLYFVILFSETGYVFQRDAAMTAREHQHQGRKILEIRAVDLIT
jgi:hypothetical protein